MEINNYQAEDLKTAIYPEAFKVVYPALGMNGEAGEVADKVKKIIRDTVIKTDPATGAICLSETQKQDIALEIGDVLWYCATLSYDLGLSLEEVAQMNIDKLNSRQKRNQLGGSGDHR